MANNAPFYKMEPPGGDDNVKPGLTDLLASSEYISQDPLALQQKQGKVRSFLGVKTEVASPSLNTSSGQDELSAVYPNVSADGTIKFSIVSQPETQHRARYQTEGSRGAIKDRAGAGFPTVKLEGYSAPVKVEIFIGNDGGKVSPHMFYQACRVTGKNSYPCEEKKIAGTDVIEVTMDTGREKVLVCDCVGILKERFADVEARFPKHKNWKTTKKKSTKCRLVFRVKIATNNGDEEILQVVSNVINCTQLPGLPEIQRMSTTSSPVKGGGELWIIGKNFLKETMIVFSYTVKNKKEPIWSESCKPEKDFLHQVHLITKIPPFVNQDITSDVEVSVYIKCGDKQSDPHSFTYTACYPQASLLPVELPKKSSGAAPAAVAINENYTKTRAVTLLPTTPTANQSVARRGSKGDVLHVLRPADSLQHNHKNKKRCLDYQGKVLSSRRTRSVPRHKTISGPSLLNEDTVFVSGANVIDEKFPVTSFSQATSIPWKSISSSNNMRSLQTQHSFDSHSPTTFTDVLASSLPSSASSQQQAQPSRDSFAKGKHEFTLFAKRSFSNDDEESHTHGYEHEFNNPATSYHGAGENSSICADESMMSGKSDFSSSLTTDFSNVFSMIRDKNRANNTNANSTNSQLQGSLSQLPVSQATTPLSGDGPGAGGGGCSGTQNTSFDTYPEYVLSPPRSLSVASNGGISGVASTTGFASTSCDASGNSQQQSPAKMVTNWKKECLTSVGGSSVEKLDDIKQEMSKEKIMDQGLTSSPGGSSGSVSFKATDEDKATISISLPTSILKDQKHFQNVIETINNTLLRSSDVPTDSQEDKGKLVSGDLNEDGMASMPSGINMSPPGKVTSVPVSVLTSKTNRKRYFSNDTAESYGGGQQVEGTPEGLAQTVVLTPAPAKASMEWEAKKPENPAAMDWSAGVQQQASPQQPIKLTEFESSIDLQPFEATQKQESAEKQPYPFTLEAKPQQDFNGGNANVNSFITQQLNNTMTVTTSNADVYGEAAANGPPTAVNYPGILTATQPTPQSPVTVYNVVQQGNQNEHFNATAQSTFNTAAAQPPETVYNTSNEPSVSVFRTSSEPVVSVFTPPTQTLEYNTQPQQQLSGVTGQLLPNPAQSTMTEFKNAIEAQQLDDNTQPAVKLFAIPPAQPNVSMFNEVQQAQPTVSDFSAPVQTTVFSAVLQAGKPSVSGFGNVQSDQSSATGFETMAQAQPDVSMFSTSSQPTVTVFENNSSQHCFNTAPAETAMSINEPAPASFSNLISGTAYDGQNQEQQSVVAFSSQPSSQESFTTHAAEVQTTTSLGQPITVFSLSLPKSSSETSGGDLSMETTTQCNTTMYAVPLANSLITTQPQTEIGKCQPTVYVLPTTSVMSSSINQQFTLVSNQENAYPTQSNYVEDPQGIVSPPQHQATPTFQALDNSSLISDGQGASDSYSTTEDVQMTSNMNANITGNYSTASDITSPYPVQAVASPNIAASPYSNQTTASPNIAASPFSVQAASPNSIVSAFTAPATPGTLIGDLGSVSSGTKSVASMDFELTDSPATGIETNQQEGEYQKVASNDMAMFDDTAPIQGDPLLSETSAVIDVQKDITDNSGGGAAAGAQQEWKASDQLWGQSYDSIPPNS